MKQHKWHKEIKAWVDGAEIEWRWAVLIDGKYDNWRPFCKENKLSFFEEGIEYRIKPQPIEPKDLASKSYLYAYFGNRGNGYQHFVSTAHPKGMKEYEYIGKIPLIVESNDD